MPDFRINDRRGQSRPGSDMQATPGSGLVMPAGSARSGGGRAYLNDDTVQQMRQNRRLALRKQASSPIGGSMGSWGSGAGDMSFAIGRPRDPMFYWRQNNLPFDISKDEEMAKLREFCRLLYLTHPLLASCIDIYAKYPLQGMKITCLAAETEVITDSGLKPIAQLSGDVHTLLTTGGKWVTAKVESFGQQKLRKITLRRNRRTKVFYATPEHRWFAWRTEGSDRSFQGVSNPAAKLTWEQVCAIRELAAEGQFTQSQIGARFGVTQSLISQIVRGVRWVSPGELTGSVVLKQRVKTEVVTDDLRPGDRLVSVYPTNRCHSTNPSPFGIAHGMTYGDGSLVGSGNGAHLDLHGHKDHQMLRYFQHCTTAALNEPLKSVQVTRVSNLPVFFKKLPSLDESTSYLYGWLAGYFAADGTVSKDGECYLDSVNLEAIERVRDICARIGIKTYEHYTVHVAEKSLPRGESITDHVMYRLPLDPGSLTESFFCIDQHRKRWVERGDRARREDWTVEEIAETDRFETVYCAKVPGTHAFAIEGNILTGNCKDKQLEEFYDDLFMNQLNYRDYLVSMSREKWMVGEAFPLGTFNETLGVWEAEELLHPNDVTVETSPISRDPRFLIKLPEALRDVLRTRTPVWEYNQIAESYPELVAYAGENSRMPVSSMLLKHIKFEADTFHKRGIPIIMRAFRSVLQEEMLNTAQDAIADRLYTPLILAKIGASAGDLGTQSPWIPTRDDLDAFRESLDEALAADFRVMVDNFTTQIENVFGKEEMPDLSEDFDRLEARMLMAFGLSQTMLTGADAGETYAADALNRDVVTQLMTDHQRQLKKFFHDRAAIVAEAQEHWDYDVRNGKRYVKMEEVLTVNEESGEETIVEQPKLLVPELEFDTLNLSDQMQERQFIEGLVATGAPIPMKRRILGTGLDFDDMLEEKSEEQVTLALAEQETRRKSYEALRDGGLPIPDDLKQDFQPKPLQSQLPPAGDAALPTLGTQDQPTPALAPTPEDEQDDPAEDAVDQIGPNDGAVPGDVYGDMPEEGDQRPPESDEQRATMPKAAKVARFRYRRGQVRKAAAEHWVAPDNSIESHPEHHRPEGRYGDVRIVGMRKHVDIAPGERWQRDWDTEAV